ncbi:quinoprotein dehydrogenase-associated SoxYZ-like carrier, partial [Sphingobium sp. 22B]|uniref:quinoprotein dehydrogenase-associated SoxYZ-like carrier n=1 Tax=Sphingobium sp. 22B TaxID=936474 RepID=UPI001F31F945
MESPMWEAHAKLLFGNDPVRFDPRVKVDFPQIAENQRSFPVAIDARAIPGVRRIVLMADLNPIPIAVDYRPTDSEAYLATRIKLDQRTPVRGAVQLASGEWLVSGGWIDAAGGGCSTPPVSRVKGDWADHLGEIRGEAWPVAGPVAASRLRLNFRHPMDTGLVDAIPTCL